MDSKRFTRRLIALGAAMFLCALVFVITLFDAQIVNGDDYLDKSIRTNAKTETVKASRGILTDRNGKVRMMCLGHVLLEEHQPHGVGNHACIITEPNDELMGGVRKLLEDLHFVGYSNFDVKYDERDGSFKFFDFNTRQGRSNYYVTGAGHNIAKLVVEDRVEAIHWAMDHARKDDVIVLCGKGHETYQEVNHQKFHMDEREIVAEHLNSGR